jgi:hypothetical protein
VVVRSLVLGANEQIGTEVFSHLQLSIDISLFESWVDHVPANLGEKDRLYTYSRTNLGRFDQSFMVCLRSKSSVIRLSGIARELIPPPSV